VTVERGKREEGRAAGGGRGSAERNAPAPPIPAEMALCAIAIADVRYKRGIYKRLGTGAGIWDGPL
jgi:hypothetical protein